MKTCVLYVQHEEPMYITNENELTEDDNKAVKFPFLEDSRLARERLKSIITGRIHIARYHQPDLVVDDILEDDHEQQRTVQMRAQLHLQLLLSKCSTLAFYAKLRQVLLQQHGG